ncbi:MAG: helix-turn-helix transcriptional regulator [Clostridia bacterium]|jgi:transcriptional regulator with XRE-family HTH domain|nr:helix-turn-helix domain-containing protein [Clostridia bacterium]MDD4275438.1 helix-turn-helix transcriptional regulator [Clostridia bacterium]
MKTSFGKRLKELRLEKNIGQIELAKCLNVSKGIISLWENDLREPTLTSLISIANYYSVKIDYLAGLED